MSKYSNNFKLEVVKYYLDYGGYGTTAKYFNIPAPSTVKKWVKKYEQHGINGLSKNINSSYDGNFKLKVIEYMHNNHLSAFETAIHFNLANENIPNKWERIYYEKGPQALYQKRTGYRKKMSSKSTKNDLSNKNEKDLIKEIQQLKMENEYLKKLNALVQERIKRENKKK